MTDKPQADAVKATGIIGSEEELCRMVDELVKFEGQRVQNLVARLASTIRHHAAQLAQQAETIRTLREALGPFARLDLCGCQNYDDDITGDHIRAAAAALACSSARPGE